jgi:hypothetical protein
MVQTPAVVNFNLGPGIKHRDPSLPRPMSLSQARPLPLRVGVEKLGNVRHLHIRYQLVRCVVSFGDIVMFFCVTEAMIAE